MTELVPQLGLRFAFLAGLVSFLSPRVLTLVSGYVSFLLHQPGDTEIILLVFRLMCTGIK